jgi:hypothetical protein
VADALRAIKFAEVVVITLDATMSFEKQDLQIIDLVAREGRALVIAINKWDLIEDREAAWKKIRDANERYFNQIRGVKIVTLAGIQGQGIDRLVEAVFAAYDAWNSRVSTAKLNRWLEQGGDQSHPPPAVAGRRVRLSLHDAAENPAAALRGLLFPAGAIAGELHAVPGEFAAPGVRDITARRSVSPTARATTPMRQEETQDPVVNVAVAYSRS